MEGSILIIIPFTNYRDEELNVPLNFFQQKGYNVKVASNKKGKAKGMGSSSYEVEILIDELNPDEFDAIILAGGKGADVLWHNKALHKFLKEVNRKKKIIAASYKSPITLAYAGILKNKRATVWIEDKDILEELGAYYTGASIEIDDNIITIDGPHSTRMFVKEIYSLIEKGK
jgi:protease I